MFENIFSNVFGKPRGRSSRSGPNDSPNQTSHGSSPMTGPFSSAYPQMPQMPQLPNSPYPPAPYPMGAQTSTSIYPSLPFSQNPSMPMPGGPNSPNHHSYPSGTMARSNQVSPIDSVPFGVQLSLNNSTNFANLDQLFKEIKKAADIVDRADTYLRSNQSDYDFKIEQGLINQ